MESYYIPSGALTAGATPFCLLAVLCLLPLHSLGGRFLLSFIIAVTVVVVVVVVVGGGGSSTMSFFFFFFFFFFFVKERFRASSLPGRSSVAAHFALAFAAARANAGTGAGRSFECLPSAVTRFKVFHDDFGKMLTVRNNKGGREREREISKYFTSSLGTRTGMNNFGGLPPCLEAYQKVGKMEVREKGWNGTYETASLLKE